MTSQTLLTNEEQADQILSNTKGLAACTVSSISGGRTSAYMALKYPTDVNLFAVVLTDDPFSVPRDKGLTQEMQIRIPHFIASRELDNTLKSVLLLEQKLGKEIKFLAADRTFDKIVKDYQALPNRRTRFCTIEMKIKPIFEWCYLNLLKPQVNTDNSLSIQTPVEMNIGFRFDERQRVFKNLGAKYNKNIEGLDWSDSGGCEPIEFSHKCDITGQFKGKHRWVKSADWRFKQFPLYTDRVVKDDILNFWRNYPEFKFPEVSNCDYCFFHRAEELEKQFKENPARYFWWSRKEVEIGKTFGDVQIGQRFPVKGKDIGEDVETQESCSCTD
jgi:hypothetical protein